MKAIRTLLVVLLLVFPGAAVHAGSHATHQAAGVVKSVDRANSSVMLAHDPVKSLNWPAMTMPFTVKDKALLDKLAPNARVQVEFVQQGRNYIITSVK